jgi:site-specific DNA-methyltransferase (adenine-specific)
MKLFHHSRGVKVIHAECLEMLRKLPDNSIDSVITDPPYGLSNTTPKHVVEAMTAWIGGDREFVPATSGGFMGKSWDNFVPPPAVWDEALRVLKPGGHLLCFAGTRTMGLMEMSIRLAGFDIRDSIAWMYGSGFPKGQDIGKVIDKAAGATREVVGSKIGQPGYSLAVNADEVRVAYGDFNDSEKEAQITAPATEEGKQWTGWNSALKPAFEPIIMARKPFKGALFKNVLKHGTGALNIDDSRISVSENDDIHAKNPSTVGGFGHGDASVYGDSAGAPVYNPAVGRYPANVILDESQAGVLDSQSEGASRFFYCAKSPKSERPTVDGKGHPTVKPLALMRYLVKLVTPPGGMILEPFAGSGATVEAALLEGFRVIASEREEEYLPLIVQRIERIPTSN